MNIGNGMTIDIWSDLLVPQLESFKLPQLTFYSVRIFKVVDLINYNSFRPDSSASQIFIPSQQVVAILSILIAPLGMPDSLVWHFAPNDQYNVHFE